MPIYKVQSSGSGSWGCACGFIVRAIDHNEAIDIAIDATRGESSSWTRANSTAILIPDDGKSEVILEDNNGA